MLNSIDLNDRNYEDMLAEAISQIPLYTNEWTNFNPSDPGLTILQNLTAFNYLQGTKINEVSEAVRLKLLALLGFHPYEYKPSHTWIEVGVKREISMPSELKLMSGDLCFETAKPMSVQPVSIEGVFCCNGGSYSDITPLLSRDVRAGAYIFGSPARTESSFLCVVNRIPKEALTFYAGMQNEERRNPFAKNSILTLAKTTWQVFTKDGFADIDFTDETGAFLKSGIITLSMRCVKPAIYTEAPVRGYAVRCVLTEQNYDLAPKLNTLSVNPVKMTQKYTQSKSFMFSGNEPVSIFSELASDGNIYVYVQEENDESGLYRAYSPFTGRKTPNQPGRYYKKSVQADGRVNIEFNKELFGFGPAETPEAVAVILYSDDIINHRRLDPVFGYDNQLIDVGLLKRIVPDGFRIIAKTIDSSGLDAYRFIEPGGTNPDYLCYDVITEEGQLRITEPGLDEGCELFICDCAVTSGASGNIREGRRFTPHADNSSYQNNVFINCSPGKGGESYETSEQLRKRFAREIKSATSAVKISDYEELALKTPGLCIHKVKAYVSDIDGLVNVAVMPYSDTKHPALSPEYIKHISDWLNKHRMLTTEIRVVKPSIIKIDITAVIYVKSYFENARGDIEALLESFINHVDGDTPFGSAISYTEIYQALSTLDCVSSIDRLSLHPRSKAKARGPDILLGNECLAAPGRINLDIIPASQLKK